MLRSFLCRVMLRRFQTKSLDSDVKDALALYEQGAYKEAYGILCRAMERKPAPAAPIAAFEYILVADLELRTTGNVHAAQKALDKSREFECPETDYFYRIQGDIKMHGGDPQAAVECYDRSVAINPSPSNLMMLGQTLSAVQDRRAVEVFTRALKRDPNMCLAYVGLAYEAMRTGDRDKALSMAKQGEQQNPSADDAFDIANLYRSIGELHLAICAYLSADKLGYAKKAQLYAEVAESYRRLGHADQARFYALSAMKHDPGDKYVRGVWRNVAVLLSKQPLPDGVSGMADIWSSVIEEDPQNCLAHIGLAFEAARAGDQERAKSMVMQAERLNPLDYDAFEIGGVYHMIGDFPAALSA